MKRDELYKGIIYAHSIVILQDGYAQKIRKLDINKDIIWADIEQEMIEALEIRNMLGYCTAYPIFDKLQEDIPTIVANCMRVKDIAVKESPVTDVNRITVEELTKFLEMTKRISELMKVMDTPFNEQQLIVDEEGNLLEPDIFE